MATIVRACDVLGAFKSESEALRLKDVAARVGLSKATAFRILYTLERRGLVQRAGAHEYRLNIRPLKKRSYRLGYGSHSTEFAFSRDVAEGLVALPSRMGLSC